MLKAIACVDRNFGIGKDNELLYHIKNDLTRFKTLTSGHSVIMGRKTWESLPKKPLQNRHNFVITSQASQIENTEDVTYLNNFNYILSEFYHSHDKIGWVIGGEMIYKELLPYCDEVYLTLVESESKQADKFFPQIIKPDFISEMCYRGLIGEANVQIEENNNLRYYFLSLPVKVQENVVSTIL